MKKYRPNYYRVFNKVLGLIFLTMATMTIVYSHEIDWLDVILFIVFGSMGVWLFSNRKNLF